MRLVILVLTIVLALTVSVAAIPTTSDIAPVKASTPGTPPPSKGPLQGGDTIATATLIASLPYDDTGTTAGYANNYDEACPYTGSTAPDVVYKYSPTSSMMIDIYTCNSGYDTKLFVYDNVYTPGAPLACNDDSALCSGPTYRSYIRAMHVTAGHTYYIVVDGFSGVDYGAYEFHVRVYTPTCLPTDCPPYAMQEGEPACYDGYVDNFNGGCNSTPNIFSEITFPRTICGTSGVYNSLANRDTDWYRFTLASPLTAKLVVCAEFPVLIGFVNLTAGCPVTAFYASTTGASYDAVTLTTALPAGTWVAWIGPSDWGAYPCGSKYIATLWEEGTVPVEPMSWGTIKALYR